MQSRLITALAEDAQSAGAKRFRDHLRGTLELIKIPNKQEAVLSALPGIYMTASTRQRRLLVESLANEHKIGLDAVVKAIGLLTFFLDAFTNRDLPADDYKSWGADLVEDGAITAAEQPAVDSLVAELRDKTVPAIKPKAMRQAAEGGVLPTFEGCGFTVEVRGVRENFYRRGMDVQREYEPEVVDHVPIASFHIAIDAGYPRDFYFQIGLDDIDYVINMLTAAKRDIAALEEYLNLSHDSGPDR